MPTKQILSKPLSEEKLFQLEPILTGDETARAMYVSADILAVVTPPFPDTEDGRRLGEFRSWLDSFIEGCQLSVAKDPDLKPADTMLARVHPVKDEFWSIRVTDPEDTPGIRAFGGFVCKDEFVALTWEWREAIDQFDDEVEAVRNAWGDIFEKVDPFSGKRLDDYLTNYYAV